MGKGALEDWIIFEENPKGRGAGHPNVPKYRQERRLAEQSFGWSSGKKKIEEFRTIGRRGRQLRRMTRM